MSEIQRTERGFALVEFQDLNDIQCTVQVSSLATDDAIWLGAKEIGLKRFEPYVGWSDVPTPGGPDGVSYIANNRMHLNREQVARLVPVLQHFADTGELCPIPVEEGQ